MCFIVVITLRVMLRLFIVLPHAEREDYYAACHRPPSARHKKNPSPRFPPPATNANSIQLLGLVVSDPSTQSEPQAVANKFDELIGVLWR
jgi:hypothetical protein